MAKTTPGPDDPLAAAARAAQAAVESEDRAREAAREENASGRAARKRLMRALSATVVLGGLALALAYVTPRAFDPYRDEDPLADERRGKAYLAGLLDEVSAYRVRHGGDLPRSLEQAVPESRLPPRGSAYRLEYRIEGGVAVLTLQGGREPLVVRGAAR